MQIASRYVEVFNEGKRTILWDMPGMYKSLELLENIDRKGLYIPSDHGDADTIVMPDTCLANLGKYRVYGCAIKSGKFWEVVIKYSSDISGCSCGVPVGSGKEPESADSIKERAIRRAKRNVRRIVNANDCKVLWTLTMALPSPANNRQWVTVDGDKQRDYDYVRTLWKAFLKRFHRAGTRFPWICVYERHDSTRTSEEKRGTWHIHFTTPAIIPVDDVRRTWRHGISNFRDFRQPLRTKKGWTAITNPGNYISKYAGKSFGEGGEYKKSYTCSRDVKRPKKYDIAEFWDMTGGRKLVLEYSGLLKDNSQNVYGLSLKYRDFTHSDNNKGKHYEQA